MAPRAKAAKLSQMLDSASEDEFQRDDLDVMPTPDSAIENQAPAKKGRGKAAKGAATVTAAKGKTAGRRASGGAVGAKKDTAAASKKAQNKRKVLAERENGNMSDTEEVDEFAEEEVVAPPGPEPEAKPTRRGRPPAKAKKAQEEESVPEPPKAQKRGRKAAEPKVAKEPAKAKAAGKGKAAKRPPSPEPEMMTIAETQPEPEPEPMDVEEKSMEVDEIPDTMPPPRPAAHRAPPPARAESKPLPARGRAGSASDTERGGSDPALRRKLGEMTKKFESLQVKYENLKEAATSNKESNFDQLKRKSEQASKGKIYKPYGHALLTLCLDQEAVIQSLKQELAELRTRASELSTVKKEVAKLEKDNAQLSAENKIISASLSSAQSENKTLSTKLAAARSSAPPETRTVPGSAVKARSVVLPGAANAAKDAKDRQLKEDLYSDLTGLIIRGVKKAEEGEDIYDCIQTGRNGSKFASSAYYVQY